MTTRLVRSSVVVLSGRRRWPGPHQRSASSPVTRRSRPLAFKLVACAPRYPPLVNASRSLRWRVEMMPAETGAILRPVDAGDVTLSVRSNGADSARARARSSSPARFPTSRISSPGVYTSPDADIALPPAARYSSAPPPAGVDGLLGRSTRLARPSSTASPIDGRLRITHQVGRRLPDLASQEMLRRRKAPCTSTSARHHAPLHLRRSRRGGSPARDVDAASGRATLTRIVGRARSAARTSPATTCASDGVVRFRAQRASHRTVSGRRRARASLRFRWGGSRCDRGKDVAMAARMAVLAKRDDLFAECERRSWRKATTRAGSSASDLLARGFGNTPGACSRRGDRQRR